MLRHAGHGENEPGPDVGRDYDLDDDDPDDGDVEEEDGGPVVVPVRRAPARPRPMTEKVHGTSSWMNKPRDGFTASMGERVPEMRRSREANYVKGV